MGLGWGRTARLKLPEIVPRPHSSRPAAASPTSWHDDLESLRKYVFLPTQGAEKVLPLHTYGSVRARSVVDRHLGNKLICVSGCICVRGRDRQKEFEYICFLVENLFCTTQYLTEVSPD